MKIEIDEKTIKSLTKSYLTKKIIPLKGKKEGFTMPELLGPIWPDECQPFRTLYSCERSAGSSMGKLISSVSKELGLRSIKEDRRGKKDAITRYFA